ncbi:MAG: ATP-binding protein [Xanthobacteraceae bacterium]|nr:ATP-binding protein [Xanthobacteraceae bacterium]
MHDPTDPARQQLGWYLRNCAMSAAAGRLEFVLLERLNVLKGIHKQEGGPDLSRPKLRRESMRELHRLLESYTEPSISNENLEQNALFARDEFGLDEVETDILLLLLRYERNDQLEEFADEVAHRFGSASRAIAALIGCETRDVHRRIMPRSSLLAGGLLTINDDGHDIAGRCGFLQLAPPVRKTMFRPYRSRVEWAEDVFGAPLASDLDWSDYEHLGETRELAAAVLAGAVDHHAAGVNILIYGPVGTGKTEFCKALATKCGLNLWSVGEVDDHGGEPNRLERLAAMRLAQRLLKRRGNAAVLFDEAEDLLAQDSGSLFGLKMRSHNGSKVHLNRVIEQNPIPVLWTCNELDCMDPAVLRRMTLAIEIKTPNRAVRTRIWQRVLAESSLQLDEGVARRLAGRYEAPPAVAANASRAAALAGGGEHEIAQTMDGVLSVLGISPAAMQAERDDFDPRLVNCSENLEALVAQLCRPGAPRNWSLFLHGLPGTGKSQFARHLAGRLGLDVIQHRASDLLSMWVGQSEKQIARAFATACAQNAMLIFDEADSLLHDRSQAARSWEVTQVNEMLTWMENHPRPFVCTTNLMDRVDQASLRRFTFKLHLEALDARQSAQAFEYFFAIEAPRMLPEGLTPGDFATVRRKRHVFGSTNSDLLVKWLEYEVEVKGLRPRGIGFLTRAASGNP